MDLGDVFTWILVAAWLLPTLFKALSRKRDDAPGAPPPEPLAPLPELAAQRVERVRQAVREASAACDPWMAQLLAPDLRSMGDDLEGLFRSVTTGTPDPGLLRRLGEIEAECRHLMRLGKQRGVATFRDLHETGDRLSEGLLQPAVDEVSRKGLALEMRPPLVVVGPPFRTPQVGTVVLPTTVRERPWEWSVLAESFGQRVADASVEEAFHSLELAVGNEPLTADSPALARVLFSSWLYVVITDASALLLLGPAYFEALAARLRTPGGARSVTRVQLRDEGLSPMPTPHARVHLAAEWLHLQGEGQAARPVRAAWDEEHGHPETLSLLTGNGEMLLPLPALFGHFQGLLEGLDGLRLAALGEHRLAEFPGLAGWKGEARTAEAVRNRLVRGEPVAGSPRALLAASVRAALQSPASGSSISTALLASLRGDGVTPVSRQRKRFSPRKARRPKPLDKRRVAEALLVGELILDRPSRR